MEIGQEVEDSVRQHAIECRAGEGKRLDLGLGERNGKVRHSSDQVDPDDRRSRSSEVVTVPSRPTSRIEDPHVRVDPAPQELVEEVDVDRAELVREVHEVHELRLPVSRIDSSSSQRTYAASISDSSVASLVVFAATSSGRIL